MEDTLKSWDELHDDGVVAKNTDVDDVDKDDNKDIDNKAVDSDTNDDTGNDNDDGLNDDAALDDDNKKSDIDDNKDDGKKGKVGDNDEDIDTSTVELSAMEQYLAQFGIEGEIIQFDDGTESKFSDLDPKKQVEVLNKLHDMQAKSIEEKYGLDQNEIGLINYLRTNNLSVEDYIENLAKERLNTILAEKEISTEDYSKISDDAIYLKFLKDSNPEATPEELEADLAKAKELKSFAQTAKSLRDGYIENQRVELDKLKDNEAKEFEKELEEQRREVVNTVADISDVSGITINKDAKNSLLDQILNVDESGDSLFMTEVFGDAEKLFNAAFWYYYGPDVMQQRETYWKTEAAKAYKRGKMDALNTSDSKNINFVNKKNTSSDDDLIIPFDQLNS